VKGGRNQGAGWGWRIVVEAVEEGGRMGEGLSIAEERPSGVWRRLSGGEEREITVSQQQQGALNEIDVTFQ